jgi:exopolyphosphatase/guanosine-5'-triphosphate,3'-diphosphate pyrophosphatase
MRNAVIDIGTNTCLLLIAEADHSGSIKVIADVHAIARLGAGVDKTKRIQQESYERLKNILLDHKRIIEDNQVNSISAIATSAMRDAENRHDIIKKIKDECGIEIELLSGSDESLWSYRGALCGFESADLQGTIAALDIGGGSTELSIGKNGKYKRGTSINIGAVRIKERFLAESNDASFESARKFIRSEIEKGFTNSEAIDKLIAVAGTPTALAAIKLGLTVFDAKKVNGAIITSSELSKINKELFRLSLMEITQKYPAVHPSRADILPAGALILEEVLSFLKLDEVQVSTCGLRYGIMIRELEKQMDVSDEWMILN